MDDIPIAVIKKNQTDELHIAIKEFKGRVYIDVRTFIEYSTTGQMGPTKKGITIGPRKLRELIEALERAEVEVQKLAQEAA